MNQLLARTVRPAALLLAVCAGSPHAETGARTMRIAVDGIVTYEDYAAVVAELRAQAGLGQLYLEEVDRTTFLWQATTTLPPESLIGLIEASGRLRRDRSGAAVTESRLDLDWTRRP